MVGTLQPHCVCALEAESVITITQMNPQKEKNQSRPTLFGSAQESVKVLNWRGFLKSAFPSLQDVLAIMAAGMATE
jgi:hypothetical protein